MREGRQEHVLVSNSEQVGSRREKGTSKGIKWEALS